MKVGLLARGASWNLLGQIVPLALAIGLTPYLIHHLGLAAYGLLVLVSSIVGFLGSVDGGLGGAATRYFTIYAGTDDRRATTRLLVSVSAVVAAGGLLFIVLAGLAGPALLRIFGVSGADAVFLLRALTIVVALGLQRGLLAGVLAARQRFAMTGGATIAGACAYAALAFLTLRTGHGLRGVAIALIAQAVVTTGVLVAPTFAYLDRRGLALLPRAEVGEFLRFACRVQVSGLSGLVNLQSDALVTGGFLTVSSVGTYSAGAGLATQLRNVPINALGPVATTLGQAVGRVGAEAAVPTFREVQRLWVVLATGWSAVAAGAGYFGVVAWLGPEFRLAGVVTVILVLGNMVNLWTGALTVWLSAIGRPELEARYGLVGMVVNLALTIALVVPFGLIGVVVGTAAGQIIGSLYLARLARTRLRQAPPSFVREVPLGAALAAGLSTAALEFVARGLIGRGAAGLVETGAVASIGLVVYAGLVRARLVRPTVGGLGSGGPDQLLEPVGAPLPREIGADAG